MGWVSWPARSARTTTTRAGGRCTRCSSIRASRPGTQPRTASRCTSRPALVEVVSAQEGARGYRVEAGGETALETRVLVRRVAVIASASGNGKTTFGRALAEPARRSVLRARSLPWGRTGRSDRRRVPRWVEPIVKRGGVGDRRHLPRQARRPRSGARGRRRLARPAHARLAAAAAAADGAPRRSPGGALERQPRDVAERALLARLAPHLRAAQLLEAAANVPVELARFEVARLRSTAEVDRFLRNAGRAT